MNALRTTCVIALAISAGLAAAPAAAQDVQYETLTKIELPGAAGTAMRVAARLGGGSMETVETTYIKGRKMRTDRDGSSTILDLDAKRIITLDHDAKSYVSLTFDEMVQQAQEAAAELEDRGKVSGQDNADAHVDFRFAVDPADERQKVAGYDAERFFMTMEAEAEYVPEGETDVEKAGTLVVLTDMWTSRDVPAFQARSAFDDASAQQYADAGAALTEGIATLFSDDPGLRVAFQQSVSEARKMEGMPVRTVTSFVRVAPGKQFDRAMVTERSAPARSVASEAAGAALGRLRGLARGARRAPPAEPAAEAEAEVPQATIFTVTSEVRNVSTKEIDAQLFEIPAGYKETVAR